VEGWPANKLKSQIDREAAIALTQRIELVASTLGKFVVLYADPPWRYEWPPMGGSNRSIENKYPTMELADIMALPVADIAHDDSILFLWATNPKLPECIEVMKVWGFTYRTNMAWCKDKIGMGYHARERHELLLIGKTGELPPPPATETRPDSVISDPLMILADSVIEAPRLGPSVKPPVVRDLLDQMYPNIRKIELFARDQPPRPLWTYWGDQA